MLPQPLSSSSVPDASRLVELRANTLLVRLAASAEEVAAAQALRYRVFYEEMSAHPTQEMARLGRDFDDYDAVADHLLVIDQQRGSGPDAVVGTYRLIRREPAMRRGGFYSATEYDVGVLAARPGEVLELGRSCVDADYRTRQVIELLWRGIAAYIFRNGIDVMFGCASLHGTEIERLKLPLSYLYHRHLAPPGLRPRAVAGRYVDMNLLPPDAVDTRGALLQLPPLIKGYLRLGGFVGDGAVIDEQFNTTDVCIIVNTELITDKYFRHYERRAKKTRPD